MNSYTKVLLASFFCFLFMYSVSSWGPLTQKYICEESVKRLWGKETSKECLKNSTLMRDKLCELVKDTKGIEYYVRCLQAKEHHPATLPYLVFNDSRLHYNYAVCPIPQQEIFLRQWVCNSSGRNLAAEEASIWLKRIDKSHDCDVVYSFCIASNYLSDSYMPLNQVMYVSPASVSELESKVDKEIAKNSSNWVVQTLAAFQYKSKRSTRRFDVSKSDIENIINAVVEAVGEPPSVLLPKKEPTCDDGIQNQKETGVDCGGPCKPCTTQPKATCFDGIMNQGELDVDCGGPCKPCTITPEKTQTGLSELINNIIGALFIVIALGALFFFLVILVAVVFILKSRNKKNKPVEAEANTEKHIEEIRDISKKLNEIKSASIPQEKPKKKAAEDEENLEEIGYELEEIKSTLKRL